MDNTAPSTPLQGRHTRSYQSIGWMACEKLHRLEQFHDTAPQPVRLSNASSAQGADMPDDRSRRERLLHDDYL